MVVLINGLEKMELLKFHGDEIKIVPHGFKVFGTSKSCKNEILISESGKILLIQGHPEYETKFVFLRLNLFYWMASKGG